jgi:uncharacterized membrane protein (DUF2068 family)
MRARSENRALVAIGTFKLVKGLLLFVLAAGLLSCLHKDIEQIAEHWINLLRVDPSNRYIAAFLKKLGLLTDKKLAELGGLTFFYAAILFTEGIGLILRKRWAEYFTVIATASFIPMEVYELFRDVHTGKIALLVLNVAIVWYLIVTLRRHAGKDV